MNASSDARVLITQPIDADAMARLEAAGVQLDVWPGPAPIPGGELLARAAGCVGIISMLTDPIDARVLETEGLAVVAQHAVGVDNMDQDAAVQNQVALTHTPGVLTEATADLAMALLLSTARRVVEGDAMVRAGEFQGWAPTMLRGMELHGATLGIVGMGRIGQAVARRAEAFGMTVQFAGRNRGVDLDTLLRTSDVISLHCPLNDQTRHLIDEEALRKMKPTALLINTARGKVVDEAALVRALDEGWIRGAGLDVFENEPAVHPGLISSKSAVLMPHVGSATWTTRRRMADMVVTDLLRVLEGQAPLHSVS